MFAPTPDCRIQMGLDFGRASPDVPEAEAKAPKTSEPGKYSPMFKLGLFFSVPPCLSSVLLLTV
jgi:hypothetical protein